MGDKFHLTDEQLKNVEYTETVGANQYSAGQTVTVHGLTQDEWDDLPEWRQRDLYYEYSAGAHAGKWDDPKNALPRGQEPDRSKWDMKAEKGYDVDPAELRQLAKDMKYKLDIWKRKLNQVGTTQISTADLGGAKGSEKFVEVANSSKSGFQEYISAIEGAYNGVITKLNATADQYENAHHNTNTRVKGVNPTGNGNPNLK
ncbi:hypothetical protein [Actinomadura sp. NPDC000600]|uniref:hypothetical protein n=1 Tax=Actinomadura sp. NPDC000600 TaxID=3154262 RepID=UPI003396C821